MNIFNYLKENAGSVTAEWRKAVFDSYPDGSGKYLTRNKDKFANPIGWAVNNVIPTIYQELIGEMDYAKIANALNDFIKIRAVQSFSTEEALGFFQELKKLTRERTKEWFSDSDFVESLLTFESRVDKAFSIAMGLYMEDKIKIAEIRALEQKKRNQKMIRRLSEKYNLIDDTSN